MLREPGHNTPLREINRARDDNETGLFENEWKRRGAQHIHDWLFDNGVTHYGSNSPSPLASPQDTVVSFHALARFALRAVAGSG